MQLKKDKNPKSDYLLAKNLRNNASPIERKLWKILSETAKARGLNFRRQQPIHPYIADFACMKARLLIELDGISHDATQKRDKKREAFLQSQGYSILRFSNNDVVHNTDGVVETILKKTETKLRKNVKAEI